MNPESQQEQRRPRKKRGPQRKYDDAFRQNALARMKTCANVAELARELGVRRKWLYQWRDEAAGRVRSPQQRAQSKTKPAAESREQKRIGELERMVARQALELDFFQGALLRVEDKRRKREQISGTPSTSKSGK